jgi:hypothetical protein
VLLGSYRPVLWELIGGANAWVSPDRVLSTHIVRQSPAEVVIDITFEKSGVGAFRCAYRIEMEAGAPLFRARCLWIENSGEAPLSLKGYYHYATSSSGYEPFPDVPDYWANVGVWRNGVSGTEYGVYPIPDDRVRISFWKDDRGEEHPDCERDLDITLAPGQRWRPVTPEPIVAVFGARQASEAK